MPLLDHFHPPLCSRRHWEGFLGLWASSISDVLNEELLPPDYFAEFQVTVGTRIEVDVGTFNEPESTDAGTNGAVARVQTLAWAPPAPAATIPAVFPDDFEVQVFSTLAGPTLVAAIELVSPANKDREETRRAFAAKCTIVTSRPANLHDELAALLAARKRSALPHRRRFTRLHIVPRTARNATKSRYGARRSRWGSLCRRCRSRYAG